MSHQALYASLQNCLQVSYQVRLPPGEPVLSEGDNFTLRITISNTAPRHNNYTNPVIEFRDLKVHVRGTNFATISNSQSNEVQLTPPESVLGAGESTTVDIRMKIPEVPGDINLPRPGDPLGALSPDKIARIRVGGTLDYEKFFRVRPYVEAEHQVFED